MSFYANSYEGEILIPIKHKDEFNEILEKVYGTSFNTDSDTIYGFDISKDEEYITIESYDEKWTSYEEQFLKEIALIVEDESYMCFEGDESSNWRYLYMGGKCLEQYADTYHIWDTTTATVNHIDESNIAIQRAAPVGHYFYLDNKDAQKVLDFLQENNIDYANGSSISEILVKNNTTFTSL